MARTPATDLERLKEEVSVQRLVEMIRSHMPSQSER